MSHKPNQYLGMSVSTYCVPRGKGFRANKQVSTMILWYKSTWVYEQMNGTHHMYWKGKNNSFTEGPFLKLFIWFINPVFTTAQVLTRPYCYTVSASYAPPIEGITPGQRSPGWTWAAGHGIARFWLPGEQPPLRLIRQLGTDNVSESRKWQNKEKINIQGKTYTKFLMITVTDLRWNFH